MSPAVEIEKTETPLVVEHAEEFPETIQHSTGAQVVQKNFTAQVTDNQGQPVIQTPPTQVITIQPPADPQTLTTQAKGDTSSASTWNKASWLRVIKKALHFGWRIVSGKSENS